MTIDPQLLAADERRAAARARLFDTVEEAKARLAPGALANDAVSGIAEKTTAVATRRPWAVAGGAAALALVIARRPLLRLFRRRRDATGTGDAS